MITISKVRVNGTKWPCVHLHCSERSWRSVHGSQRRFGDNREVNYFPLGHFGSGLSAVQCSDLVNITQSAKILVFWTVINTSTYGSNHSIVTGVKFFIFFFFD